MKKSKELMKLDENFILLQDVKKKDADLNVVLLDLATSILGASGADISLWRKNPMVGLFNKNIDQKARRFIAACLIRFLNMNPEVFSTWEYYHQAISLFDEIFSRSLYRIFNLNEKDQNYEKVSRLQSAVSNRLDGIRRLISSYNDLKKIDDFQNRYMRLLNDDLGKILIRPFIPVGEQDLSLNNLFDSIKAYVNANSVRIVEDYDNVLDCMKRLVGVSKNCKTTICDIVIIDLTSRLNTLLLDDFKRSPASQPAELDIEQINKKYPLYKDGEEIKLFFSLMNRKPGIAYDTELKFESNLELRKQQMNLGKVTELERIDIEIPIITRQSKKNEAIELQISYSSYSGETQSKSLKFDIYCQNPDIDWDDLRIKQPYSLEPVTTKSGFIGRSEILKQLESCITSSGGVTSCFIYGQKRVGKTSIAKVIKEIIADKYGNEEYELIYLEGGEYVHTEPEQTIESLGKKLVRRFRNLNTIYGTIQAPKFNGALSPFTDYLESVQELTPQRKFIFILDEFDELPINLFKRTSIGNAFFLTLRSISAKKNFGFILIGGEKMDFIINERGDALNKFVPIRVDYFERSTAWTDYCDLVRKPVESEIEYTDEAINRLYDLTAGNPFFSKLVCMDVYNLIIKNKDVSITHKEVDRAVRATTRSAKVNSFQHFWQDGIIEMETRSEEIAINRKKMLLALAQIKARQDVCEKDTLADEYKNWDPKEVNFEENLREFIRRKIIVEENGIYSIMVKLFENWLQSEGSQQLITMIVDQSEYAKRKKEEEKYTIKSEEIVNLLDEKGFEYQGRIISEDRIRAWLNQFKDVKEQRLMFKILSAIQYYNGAIIRNKLAEANDLVTRNLISRVGKGHRKRKDIIVSHLDDPLKSGSDMAKKYCDENNIFSENRVEQFRIAAKLATLQDSQKAIALVFVDDFIGTGKQASGDIKKLYRENARLFTKLGAMPGEKDKTRKLEIYFIAICGFERAKEKIEQVIEDIGFDIHVHICDTLDESDKVFDKDSGIFNNDDEMNDAKVIASDVGQQLVKNAPLGFGDCQAAVVFEHRCPNNTLPILWARSDDFKPLFGRMS